MKNKKPITATLYCLLIYQLSKQLPWCTACSQWCNLLPSISGNSFGSGPLPGLWCCNSCTTGYLHFQTEARDLQLLIEHCLILGAGPNFGALGKNELLFCFLFYDSTTHSYAAFHTVILQTLARSIASNHLFISSFPPSPCKFSIHSSGRPPGQVQHIFSSNWKNSQYGLHSLKNVAKTPSQKGNYRAYTDTAFQKLLSFICLTFSTIGKKLAMHCAYMALFSNLSDSMILWLCLLSPLLENRGVATFDTELPRYTNFSLSQNY